MAIPSGEIYLCENVPLTASYEHTIDFKNKNEQFNYFRGFVKYPLTNYTYIRKEREFLSVELPISALDSVNYMLFRSADGDRLYYAFVTNKVYVNDHVSYIYFTLDVMQTYQFDYEWRASYIAQSHVDRWTAEHKPIYSKTDEGLDYGSEYSVETGFKIEQSSAVKWLLVSMVDYAELVSEGHVMNNSFIHPVGNSFVCFLVPVFTDKRYRVFIESADNGDGEPIGDISDYMDLVEVMLTGAIGNYIRSITLLTYNPFIESEELDGDILTVRLNGAFTYAGFTSSTYHVNLLLLHTASPEQTKGGRRLAITDWNNGIEYSLPTAKQWEEVKANPYTTPRDKRFESKLLCHPYRFNLLTDWRNNPIVFKNEYMTADKIEICFSYAVSYNAPFRFWIKDYKKDPQGRYTTLSQPLGLEFPIISDAYYTYMLENKNTIQANVTNSAINAVSSTINGAISGGGVGGVGGALYGAISGGVSGALNVQALIRSENAKQADIQAKPDSVINSTDSAFHLLDDNSAISFYRMRICCENEEIIAQIFNMTGYKVNRVEVPNTRSRTRFNYLKTVGANIIGSINQADLLTIKEIFDNGVTIWHYTEKDFNILDYSYENIEVNLI